MLLQFGDKEQTVVCIFCALVLAFCAEVAKPCRLWYNVNQINWNLSNTSSDLSKPLVNALA
jgi:hypothetical protein